MARPAVGSAEEASAGSVAEGSDLVFVVMPFADVERPAIGVSLLQPAAREAGQSSVIEYCNIAFADELERGASYGTISDGLTPDILAGEWIFADDVFGDRISAAGGLRRAGARPAMPRRDLLGPHRRDPRARADYLDACTARILARRPRVVGFTTTFHQTCASLAVARRLKKRSTTRRSSSSAAPTARARWVRS